jgi:hypothetical protein
LIKDRDYIINEMKKLDKTEVEQAQSMLQMPCLLTWVSQVFCCAVLLYEMKTNANDYIQYPTQLIVLLRFACGAVLHNYQSSEIVSGLTNMKFTINHAYRFSSLTMTFCCGLMQTTSGILIEITNLFVILNS